MNKRTQKTLSCFTLAEVLVTLMLIGVVAVFVIPQFVNGITNTVFEKQRNVAQKKLIEGLRQMRTDGALNTQYTTQQFVEQMQKYFRISLVCDSNNLTKCFANTITASSKDKTGVVYNVTDLKTAKDIYSNIPYDSDVYGLKLNDGTSMLLYTDPTCVGPELGEQETAPDKCISYLIDVNNTKGPNTTIGNKDILGTIPIDEMILLGWNGSFGYMTKAECEAFTLEHPDLNDKPCHYDTDYWIAAVKACNDKGMRLPTQAELAQLATDLGCPESSSGCDKTNSKMASSIFAGWNGRDYLYLVNSPPYSHISVNYWIFSPRFSRLNGSLNRRDSRMSAICVR